MKRIVSILCLSLSLTAQAADTYQPKTTITSNQDLFAQLPEELRNEIMAALFTSDSAGSTVETLKQISMTSKNNKKLIDNIFKDENKIEQFATLLNRSTKNIFRSLNLLYAYNLITKQQYTVLLEKFKKQYQKDFEQNKEDEKQFIRPLEKIALILSFSDTPLTAIQEQERKKMLEELQRYLSEGINVNMVSAFRPAAFIQEGNTPLHVAVDIGDIDLVKLFLAQKGINIEFKAPGKDYLTALELAKKRKSSIRQGDINAMREIEKYDEIIRLLENHKK